MAKQTDKTTEGHKAAPDDLDRLAGAFKDMPARDLMANPTTAMMAATAFGFGMATQMTGLFLNMMQSMAAGGAKAEGKVDEPVVPPAKPEKAPAAAEAAPVAKPATTKAAPAPRKAKAPSKSAPVKPAPAKTTKPAKPVKAASEPAKSKPVRKSKVKLADLKQVDGIGPKVEERLKAMGVATLADIAGWSAADIERFDGELSLGGRIGRDDWVGQAKALTGAGA